MHALAAQFALASRVVDGEHGRKTGLGGGVKRPVSAQSEAASHSAGTSTRNRDIPATKKSAKGTGGLGKPVCASVCSAKCEVECLDAI